MTVLAYTDGACSGNPGPGGWGVFLQYPDGQTFEYSGGDLDTTNNRMELQAAIAALERSHGPIKIHTDSEYVKNGITTWIASWKKKGWRNSKGEPVKNKDLWEKLDYQANKPGPKRLIQWAWVKGHAGDPGNERADALAVSEVKKIQKPSAPVISLVKPDPVPQKIYLTVRELRALIKDCPDTLEILWEGPPAIEHAKAEVPSALIAKLAEDVRCGLIEENGKHFLVTETELRKAKQAKITEKYLILQ